MRLGAHLSIAKGLPDAVAQARYVKANTFAYFTRNPRGGKVRDMPPEEIQEWEKLREEDDLYPIVGHLPYTINLASPREEARNFGRQTVYDDLERASRYGAEYLVLHPGSHVGDGVEKGLRLIIEGLEAVLKAPGDTMLLLETMSGQGTEIGGTFGELQAIIEGLGSPPRLGVCLDTCHLFAAGYPIHEPEGLEKVLSDLDKAVGLERVKALHLNDSVYPFGSRRDRHARLGEGKIGREGLKVILSHPFIRTLPWILETPVDDWKEYKDHIAVAKELAGL
ncbi:MAG: deoxyribonuclease IV [Clostridiales bacterium]|nr:deoxyribonuclease IV [Clostridiales bacterium]